MPLEPRGPAHVDAGRRVSFYGTPALASPVMPLAHAADYLEGAVLAVAFVVFLGLVARERVRARRAAAAERLPGPDRPGDEPAASKPLEPRNGAPR